MCFARQSYATFARTNSANALEFLNNIHNFIALWLGNKFNQKITFADRVIKIAAAAALTCKLRRAKLANRRIVNRVHTHSHNNIMQMHSSDATACKNTRN